jgi:hypothetical protein
MSAVEVSTTLTQVRYPGALDALPHDPAHISDEP